MHGPDKGNYRNECTFVAIREPELLVWDRESQPIFQVEVIFEEIAESETKVTFKQILKTVEECNKIKTFAPKKMKKIWTSLKTS
jgi:hypothetical protein